MPNTEYKISQAFVILRDNGASEPLVDQFTEESMRCRKKCVIVKNVENVTLNQN